MSTPSSPTPPKPLWQRASSMRFDHFMDAALFDPNYGYYAKRIRHIGEKGDFATSATLSKTLGKAIAHWATRSAHQASSAFNLIEIGAGDGSLAKAVLSALPLWKRLRCRYHIVETSAPLTQLQRKKLGRRVSWHQHPESALHTCHGHALIFHNELVDAFPVRIFQTNSNQWQELWVHRHAQGFTEEFRPAPATLPGSTGFSWPQPKGQRIEVLASYRQWLQSWRCHWHSGEMLSIDYGDQCPAVYHRRPNGTLRGYLFHQVISGPAVYQNPGHQDLTNDVNFSDLIEWGNELNLETIQFGKQIDLLRPFATASLEDQFLMNAEGAGGEFKFLRQRPK